MGCESPEAAIPTPLGTWAHTSLRFKTSLRPRASFVGITTPGFPVLEESFEDSDAFAWLGKHAGRHGFHLSYPRGNRHRVAYEPWHWAWRPDR